MIKSKVGVKIDIQLVKLSHLKVILQELHKHSK